LTPAGVGKGNPGNGVSQGTDITQTKHWEPSEKVGKTGKRLYPNASWFAKGSAIVETLGLKENCSEARGRTSKGNLISPPRKKGEGQKRDHGPVTGKNCRRQGGKIKKWRGFPPRQRGGAWEGDNAGRRIQKEKVKWGSAFRDEKPSCHGEPRRQAPDRLRGNEK